MINIYQKGNSGIVVLSRDNEGKRIVKEYQDFRPYMYVQDDKGQFKSLMGQTLKKIVYKNPGDVKRERENYPTTWESDVLYPVRFLIDRIPEIEFTPIRKCYLDIETGDIQNYREEVLIPKQPILCIGCYDNFTNKCISFLQTEGLENYTCDIDTSKLPFYTREQLMLKSFIKFIEVLDPDLLIGWNINNFDIPYLINRCRQLKIPVNNIAHDKHTITIKKFESKLTKRRELEININGRYCFDLLKAYKYIKVSGLDSHNLNDVAQLELGHGKTLIQETPGTLWKQGKLNELLTYNINDVMLTYELDNELGIIDRFNELRIETGCRWNELWQTTKIHNVGLLRHAKEWNSGIILPRRKTRDNTKRKRIKGGKVHTSIPGLHNGVVVFDFVSLYPNIMRTWNMSPETKLPDGEIHTPNGIRFTNKRIGFIPSYITKILQLRELYKIKKAEAKQNKDIKDFKKYDLKQHAIKLKANSLFGDFDNPGFLFFDQDISASITITGQDSNKWVTRVAQDTGYSVIYGDTDSLFIELGNQPIDKLVEEGSKIEQRLNNSLTEFTTKYGIKTHWLNISFDKIFNPCYFGKKGMEGVKKRYAGIQIWER